MKNPFILGVGGVVSTDIAVPDHSAEVEFYSKILTTGDAPFWRNDLMNNLGKPIIGLGERTPEYEKLPLQWTPHFQVADVANSVTAALELGGKELFHARDDDGNSQWAGLTDPDGACVGLIPAVDRESAGLETEKRQGKITWLSLTATDANASQNFYSKVIGWRADSGDSTETLKFDMMIDQQTAAAEINQSQQNEVPPVWLIHLPVGDLEASLRQVEQGGGSVIRKNDKTVVIKDPIGVYLALVAE